MRSAYSPTSCADDVRPRRNERFWGALRAPSPLPESSFRFSSTAYFKRFRARAGIQFDRLYHLILMTAIASTLAIFWLLLTITRMTAAAAGALATLCFGTLPGPCEAYYQLLKKRLDFFPLRVTPSVAFASFLSLRFVWRALEYKSGAVHQVGCGAG